MLKLQEQAVLFSGATFSYNNTLYASGDWYKTANCPYQLMNELILIIPGSDKEFWSQWPQTQQWSEPFVTILLSP